MLINHTQSAIETGQNSLTDSPFADRSLEDQLTRILARVPPLITLPLPGKRCPYTGESRTSLSELIAPCSRNGLKPAVKAIYKRSHKHATRGKWLIPSENLFRYLLALADNSTGTYLELSKERKGHKEKRGVV
jgi:hypothetical protein